MADTGVVLLDSETGRNIVRRRCRKEGVRIAVLEDLVIAELENAGKRTRHGLYERFEEILDQDEDS